MTSQFKDISKFVVVFATMSAIFIPSYLHYFPSESRKLIDGYLENKINQQCPLSQQECFKKTLSIALTEARAMDLEPILEKIEEVYQLDIHTTNDKIQKSIFLLYKLENIVIFINYFKNFTINRNSITFIDILFVPYAKSNVDKWLNKKLKEIDLAELDNLPTQLNYRKEFALKILY